MMTKYIITLVCMIIIKSTRGSIVYDALNQESIHISKYCPKQRYCREGTHVVCMYYDHNQEFGPHCENPVKVEVTPKMVQKILANINDIRGEVATGKEKGKYDEVLPRAYGLTKLEWDKELAFLAQVLANQCLGGSGDLCRATDRFPNPSQTIAIIRYKYPDWEYLKPNNSEKGLNEEKLIFALDKFFKSTHALKKTVTKKIIMNCPTLQELPDTNLKFYLNVIRGGATHIGCGVSAYSKYKLNGDGESMQNNVQIVCNISDAPKSNQPVYKIAPPIPGTGYTKRCGCPRGYKETRSCLCERDSTFLWKGQQLKNQLKTDLKQDLSKNVKNRSNNDEENGEAMSAVQPKLSVIQVSSENKGKQTSAIKSPHTSSKSRHFILKGYNNSEENNQKGKQLENIESTDEFSKITSAITPKKKHIYSKLTKERNDSEIKLSKSQNNKSVFKTAIPANAFEDLIFNVRSYVVGETTTESTLNVVEENVVENVTEKSIHLRPKKHKKLLSILESLEQEVKNLKFDDDLKQIFDLKMRKIYETGLNKIQKTPSPSALNKRLNKKDLLELKDYLESETNESIGDEIASLRRMIYRLSKGAQKEYNTNSAETENDPNQNDNYAAQQYDAYHGRKYVEHLDNSYEIIPRETTLAEHRNYQILVNDMNGKQNAYRYKYDNTYNLQDDPETKNQETVTNNNARQTILSTAIGYNLDDFDNEKIELERSAKIIELQQQAERNNEKNFNMESRHLYKDKNVKSSGRRTSTISNRRLQLSYPFSGKNKNGKLHQIMLRRPSQIDSLRISINKPRPSIYSSDRETFMF